MSEPKADGRVVSALCDQLGPLPERMLAEIRNDFMNRNRLSETGADYWGSNWYVVRKLYTADDMQAYALQERDAERERWRPAAEKAKAALSELLMTRDPIVYSEALAALDAVLGPNDRGNADQTARTGA